MQTYVNLVDHVKTQELSFKSFPSRQERSRLQSSEVEEPLLSQILADPEVSGRIDELFFEHHVHLHPLSLVTRGWGPSVRNRTRCTIHDSYALFRALRERGIRAHSWV